MNPENLFDWADAHWRAQIYLEVIRQANHAVNRAYLLKARRILNSTPITRGPLPRLALWVGDCMLPEGFPALTVGDRTDPLLTQMARAQGDHRHTATIGERVHYLDSHPPTGIFVHLTTDVREIVQDTCGSFQLLFNRYGRPPAGMWLSKEAYQISAGGADWSKVMAFAREYSPG